MVQIENLTTDAVEVCIINLCTDSGDSEKSNDLNNPNETHWRVGLLNSEYGRQRLHEVLEGYSNTLQAVLSSWGDHPSIDEAEE